MSNTLDDPPSNWFPGARRLADDTYVADRNAYRPDDVIVWHWCIPACRWEGAQCAAHTLVSTDPLELTPSLACGHPRCQWHGHITAGQWRPV